MEMIPNPFQYTGREFDAETGLGYYRARYYDPTAGRFLSEDPPGFDGGDVNFYRYVENAPVSYVDPFGFEKLPANPSGLGPQWQDATPKDPNGNPYPKAPPRFRRDTDGFEVEFDRGDPKAQPNTWKGRDHWREVCNGKRDGRHLAPGTEIPDPPQPEPLKREDLYCAPGRIYDCIPRPLSTPLFPWLPVNPVVPNPPTIPLPIFGPEPVFVPI